MVLLTLLGSIFVQINSSEGCACSWKALRQLNKHFVSLYLMNPFGKGFLSSISIQRTSRKFIVDFLLLSAHLVILSGVIFQLEKIPIYAIIWITELCFLFSSFMISVMPFTVIQTSHLKIAYLSYFIETSLIWFPKLFLLFDFISQDKLSIGVFSITLLIHLIALIVLVFKATKTTNNKILIQEAKQIMLINLKDDAQDTSLLSSNSDETKQHCLVAFKNTIKLIQLSVSHKSQDDSDSQNLEENNNKNSNDIEQNNPNINHKNNNNPNSNNLTNNQLQMNPITLSEIISSGIIPSNNAKNINNEADESQQQPKQREKSSTLSKILKSTEMKLKLEDEPTVRKNNNKILYESPSLMPILSTINAPQSSTRINNGILNSQNLNTLPNSQSWVLQKPSGFKGLIPKDKEPSRIRETIHLQNERFYIEIINSIEVSVKGKEEIELLSFDEDSQQVLVKIEGAVLFYSVPDFKKKKSILLDDTSEYIFNSKLPTCVQYHYNSTANQYQFTPLDLSKEQITKNDMKYSSINMNYPEFKDINGFLYLGCFGNHEQSNSNSSRCGSCNDNENHKNNKINQEAEQKQSKFNKSQVLFIQDGPDLVTVNMGSLSMETYQNKLSVDEQEKLSIGQLNSRQVAINTQKQMQTSILDIPTNICYKILTDLDIGSELLPITNLQNQLILNSLNTQCSVVFDLLTKKSVLLSGCGMVSSAFFIDKHLYVIDSSTNQLKVYSLQNSPFKLLPPQDSGISCISAAFT